MSQMMDASADPCQDFYQYACGGWIAEGLPEDHAKWTIFAYLAEQTENKLRDLIESQKDAGITVDRVQGSLVLTLLWLVLQGSGGHPIAYSLTQQPFWLENEAARASKLANDHFCLPLCKNGKRCYSDKDLSYLNFPSDKQKRKHTSSIEYTQGPCLWPSSLVAKCKMVTA